MVSRSTGWSTARLLHAHMLSDSIYAAVHAAAHFPWSSWWVKCPRQHIQYKFVYSVSAAGSAQVLLVLQPFDFQSIYSVCFFVRDFLIHYSTKLWLQLSRFFCWFDMMIALQNWQVRSAGRENLPFLKQMNTVMFFCLRKSHMRREYMYSASFSRIFCCSGAQWEKSFCFYFSESCCPPSTVLHVVVAKYTISHHGAIWVSGWLKWNQSHLHNYHP